MPLKTLEMWFSTSEMQDDLIDADAIRHGGCIGIGEFRLPGKVPGLRLDIVVVEDDVVAVGDARPALCAPRRRWPIGRC